MVTKTNKKKSQDNARKHHIEKYIELRKKDPNAKITRDQFVKATKISRHQIEAEWGTYLKFRAVGDAEFLDSLSKSQRALLTEVYKEFDPNATKEECIDDLRRVQEDHQLEFITRTTYRNEGRYADSTWNRYFGTFQEFRRQAGLELSRPQAQLEKHIAKHASMDHYNEYFTKEVLPYHNKYEKPTKDGRIKTIMVIGDVHDKECDEFTLATFVDTCIRKQPDVIVLNGDIFDFYEFSKFTQDPRQCDIVGRYQFIHERLFGPLRKGCPDAQIDFIMGNHEFRLIRLLADVTPHLRVFLSDVLGITFEKVFQLDKFQINWRSKVNLKAFTKKDINDELRKNYAVYYNCYAVAHVPDKTLMGAMDGTNAHHHKAELSSHSTVNPLDGSVKKTTWVQTPSGHVPDAEYLDKVSSWNTGFLEVTVNIEKSECLQKIIITKDDWTVVDGVLYERKNQD